MNRFQRLLSSELVKFSRGHFASFSLLLIFLDRFIWLLALMRTHRLTLDHWTECALFALFVFLLFLTSIKGLLPTIAVKVQDCKARRHRLFLASNRLLRLLVYPLLLNSFFIFLRHLCYGVRRFIQVWFVPILSNCWGFFSQLWLSCKFLEMLLFNRIKIVSFQKSLKRSDYLSFNLNWSHRF